MIKTINTKTEDIEFMEMSNGATHPFKSKTCITITITETHSPDEKNIYKEMIKSLIDGLSKSIE